MSSQDTNLVQFSNINVNILWVKNGVLSLAIAGIYSIILVGLRTPQLSHLISNPEIFKSALVVHVNLSVLVWLMSITACIWSYKKEQTFIARICPKLSWISSIMIGISPFIGPTLPVMNNYIPMLENITFIIGMSLFAAATLLLAGEKIWFSVSSLCRGRQTNGNEEGKRIDKFAIFLSALILLEVWACFIMSYYGLQNMVQLVPIDIDMYYELLFWSGGHLLQFLYVQILMIIWIKLVTVLVGKNLRFQGFYLSLFTANFIFSFAGLFGHFFYSIIEPELKEYYTTHMKYFGGIAPTLTALFLIREGYKLLDITKPQDSFIKAGLICSGFLFFFGGVTGLLISGINVTIPAHYHGSIVGISIAFMTFSYVIVFGNVKVSKYAKWQLYILTIGQILHISGLAIAGGYSVLRKDPGTELVSSAKVAMGFMGGGGLIAILGGLMFVIICGKRLFLKI